MYQGFLIKRQGAMYPYICGCLDHKLMTPTPCTAKTTTFFQLLNQTPGLDQRDNRGKRYPIGLVLSGLVLALCCGRDGKLSSLHRHIVNHFDTLCKATQMTNQTAISRAQLPLLLAKVNGVIFAQLLFEWFDLPLDEELKRCGAARRFALDGKELRGSIQPDQTRGEACVSVLAHDSQEITNQAYYNGTKESERPTVRQLLTDTGLYNQKLTLDALHLIPLTLNAIHGAKGVYVIGLKANQAHLYRYCLCSSLVDKADYARTDVAQRGHGRIDQRHYDCFRVAPSALALRWKDAGLHTFVRVTRIRQGLDGSGRTEEVSYFLSNAHPTSLAQAEELFNAIRQHWRVEVMHHVRDVTLAEDALQSRSQAISRLMSSLRTLTLNLLRRAKPKNMAAQLDSFADKFHSLIEFMTQQMVL
jgi:predicted transposase YbfD/YdcC